MNAKPESPASPCPALRPDRPLRLRRALAALLVLLLAVIFVAIRIGRPSQSLVWLTPAELASASRPPFYAPLKYKLVSLVGPLWGHFRKAPPLVRIDSTYMALPGAASQPIGLPVASMTNADGLRAWILSPSEFSAIQAWLKAATEASVVSRPRIITSDGGRAVLFAGPIITRGRISYTEIDDPAPHPGSAPIGLRIDITPKLASRSIKVTCGITCSEWAATASGSMTLVQTNLATACRALVPNGGALAVAGWKALDSGWTSYWLFLSPNPLDSQGKPIKF